MTHREHYDIIIIGTGAGGGTIAQRLAPSGLRILILERGGFLPRERENWDTDAVAMQKRYQAKEIWYDKADMPFSPYTHYWVGGNTKVYGAALLRFREDDFEEVRHYGGISPAWPINYADLEPYYTEAERLYWAHGQRGLDPFDPPASGPYPHPPLAPEPRMKQLFDDLVAIGRRPFPVPLGVRLAEKRQPHAEYRLSTFDGYPDLTEVKADSHVVGVNAALLHRNVTLLTGWKVEKLETGPNGRVVTGVVATSGPDTARFTADTVVLACGAINSAALLLRSANGRHPRGLANSSGQVGRNYMTHNNGLVMHVSETVNPSQFQKSFGLTDFYRACNGEKLPLGTIQLMGKPDPGTVEWLRNGKLPGKAAADILAHSIDFFITAEDLPDPGNRVTLREDGSIKVSYTENNREAYDRLEGKLRGMLDEVDARRGRKPATYLTGKLGVSGVSHQCGTLRFGADPATSVLDTKCKAHDLDNLFVVDGSFFVSSAAVNPSLTIMANALRVGDHILDRLGASCTPAGRNLETAR